MGSAAPAATDRVERDLARVRQNEASLPWLSLNTSGHTAAVRALAFTPDSKRLCSAGLDKTVQVWNTGTLLRDLARTRLLERTIRWQVGRGPRGGVFALAAAPSDGLLALAGYGAMGGTGEILLVDPVQGTLVKALTSHRQTVCSLAFSADGNTLASLDVSGEAILWRRGQWQPEVVRATDETTYGKELAQRVAKQPQVRPLAIVGNTHLALGVLPKKQAKKQLQWKLALISLTNPKESKTLDKVHLGMVSALAASPDGMRLASADLAGGFYAWELTEKPRAQTLASDAVITSAAFAPAGEILIAGTAVSPEGQSTLQIWDVLNRQLKSSRSLADHVSACAISPDGKHLAYVGGADHEIYVGLLDGQEATALAGATRRVVKVAFAAQEPLYRVAFGTTGLDGAFNDYGPLEQSFDCEQLELSAGQAPQAADWLAADWSQGAWRARPRTDGGLQFSRDGADQGFARFDPILEGKARCYCWIPGPDGQPSAVAVGTDLQNTIFVCRLVEKGPCPILRQFRGHWDFVASVGSSRDGKYLASASADGTVRIWSLAEFALGRETQGRWGAELASQDGRLVAASVHPAGPLHFKGLRQGDSIERIMFHDGRRVVTLDRPADIQKRLVELPWATQVVFYYTRSGQAQEPFQLLPAWQPLANLIVSKNREWAFWTPQGYYEASANGHTMFGWQVNRGLDRLPDFFRADQFRRNLERPDVLEHLLKTGSLEGAFRQAAMAPPDQPDRVVERQVEVTPTISFVTPRAGENVPRRRTTVRARIRVPRDTALSSVRLFAGGVVAPGGRVVEELDAENGRDMIYEWEAGLPTDERNLIQVMAGTTARTVGLGNVLIERGTSDEVPDRAPRLHILAVGVDQYQDPQVQPLGFSVADARAVVQAFAARSQGIYELSEPTLLVNDQVTRASWQESFTSMGTRLREDVRADDLLVIFMAGHGFVDQQTQQYFFASYDLSRDGFEQGQYAGSISWSDFELLADVPCRKLAFLDTCHSGAIQPLRSRDLKAAIRELQEDVVLTVTASAGEERSEEKASWQHGAFTKSLLEALSGKADVSADGVVTLHEVVAYVQQTVPELTEGRQNPTAAPLDLLPYVSIRLTNAERPAR